MAQIKPAEVTAILRQELAGFSTEAEIKEIGSVLQVGDGIARVYGLTNAQSGELVEFVKTDTKGIVLNLEEDNVGIVLLGGFVINLDNFQLDQSIAAKIKQLKKDFEKNLFIKGF